MRIESTGAGSRWRAAAAIVLCCWGLAGGALAQTRQLEGVVAIVDDDTGVTGATGQVDVANVEPKVTLTPAKAIDEGDTVTLEMFLDDPGLKDELTIRIQWDDGESELIEAGLVRGRFTATHTYADDDPSGTPEDEGTIFVYVEDDDDGSVEVPVELTVRNVDPSALSLGSDRVVKVGDAVALRLAFTDPGLPSDTHDFSWTVTAPDGTASTTTLSDDPTFAFTPTLPGEWSIAVTVEDDDTGSATTTLRVRATPEKIDPPKATAAPAPAAAPSTATTPPISVTTPPVAASAPAPAAPAPAKAEGDAAKK